MGDVSTAWQSFVTSGFGTKAWRPVFAETTHLARSVLHLRIFVGYFLVHVVKTCKSDPFKPDVARALACLACDS